MRKIRLFFGNLLILVGQLLKGKEPPKILPKTLQVIFHFSPTFELLAYYYDLSWSVDEVMFGKSYPPRCFVPAIHEAVEYAKNNNYDFLQVDTMERGKSPEIIETVAIH